jgi:hypothetical protein
MVGTSGRAKNRDGLVVAMARSLPRWRLEAQLDVLAKQHRRDRRTTPGWKVLQFDAGHRREQLGREVLARADTRR